MTGARCDNCKKYRAVLRVMHSRQSTSTPSSERTAVSSHVNYRYLTTPEKTARMTNLKAEVSQQKRKIESLQQKVKKLTEAEGMEVDDQMHDDLYIASWTKCLVKSKNDFPSTPLNMYFGTSS